MSIVGLLLSKGKYGWIVVVVDLVTNLVVCGFKVDLYISLISVALRQFKYFSIFISTLDMKRLISLLKYKSNRVETIF